MEFVPVSPRLMQHKKIIKLAHLMKYKPIEVWPRVVKLWAWALENAKDGDVSVLFYEGLEVGLTEQVLELPNKTVAGVFMAMMIEVGLLDQRSDKTVVIHDWFLNKEKGYTQDVDSAKSARRKSEQARRAALARWKNKSKADANYASASISHDARAQAVHDAQNEITSAPHDAHASSAHNIDACNSHMPNSNNKNNGNKNNGCVYTYTHIKNIIELYNSTCARAGMIPILSPPGTAIVKKILKHLRAGRDERFFAELFERASKSAYLCGKNDNGFVADIFWLLDDEHAERVLSGFYDNRASARDDRLTRYFAPQTSEGLETLTIVG